MLKTPPSETALLLLLLFVVLVVLMMVVGVSDICTHPLGGVKTLSV